MSDYDEVKIFFTDKYQIYNSYIAENTNGWAAEKKEWRRKIALAANKQTFENEVRVKADALRAVSWLGNRSEERRVGKEC